MFCPETLIYQSRFLQVWHYGKGDVRWETRGFWERYNPFRYEICVSLKRSEPPTFTINTEGKLNRLRSNFTWWLYRKRLWERKNP